MLIKEMNANPGRSVSIAMDAWLFFELHGLSPQKPLRLPQWPPALPPLPPWGVNGATEFMAILES